MKKTINNSFKISGDYQYKALQFGHPIQRQWHRNRLILIETILDLNTDDIVCDVGCGSANSLFAFCNKVKQFEGADNNKDCVNFINYQISRKKITNSKAYYWDIMEPPKRSKHDLYNKIILNEVVEHFEYQKIRIILKNIKKVLKKRGKILITTPNCGLSLYPLMELIIDKFKLFPKLWGEQHKVKFDQKHLISVAKENQLKIIKVGGFGLLSPFLSILSKNLADLTIRYEIRYIKYFQPQLFILLEK